jgi:hypothetical protein
VTSKPRRAVERDVIITPPNGSRNRTSSRARGDGKMAPIQVSGSTRSGIAAAAIKAVDNYLVPDVWFTRLRAVLAVTSRKRELSLHNGGCANYQVYRNCRSYQKRCRVRRRGTTRHRCRYAVHIHRGRLATAMLYRSADPAWLIGPRCDLATMFEGIAPIECAASVHV